MSFTADTVYYDQIDIHQAAVLNKFLDNNITQLSHQEKQYLTGVFLMVLYGTDEGNIAPLALLIMVSWNYAPTRTLYQKSAPKKEIKNLGQLLMCKTVIPYVIFIPLQIWKSTE